ncbi:hypothetical protein C478_18391 [Natrinema thermotolerans DSM 11552]|nr:hypothetical protein C478_18391 [Natrinema thermotolerans DSM 11552]
MSAQSPRSTDHDAEAGSTLNRREFSKAVGMAAAIGGGAAASSGRVRAQDGLVDGVRSSISGAATVAGYGLAAASPVGAVGLVGAVAYGELRDAVNSSPSADKLILRQLIDSEYKTLTNHETTFSNRIIDAKPVAHLEARHGMTQKWENGASASEGYDYALSMVRQYWELPEFNHIHVTNKSLLQLKFAAETARSSDFNYPIVGLAENSSGTTRQIEFNGETQVVDFTLYDGTAISNVDPGENEDILGDYESAELETPVLEFINPDDGSVIGTAPVISNAVADSWDPNAEEVTYEVGGETLTTELKFTVNNIGDPTDGGEPPAVVFDGSVFYDLLHRIHTNSDETVATYDQAFVEDIYGELDAGNISPEQVRGPEGMTHFLSGTEDPSHKQFRLAMLQTLGMEQPDFTRIAQMTVNYTGATGRSVDTDTGHDRRHVHPDGYVDGKSYNGVLFSDGAPEGGFQPGGTYQVSPPLAVVSGSTIEVRDAVTGDFRYSVTASSPVFTAIPTTDGRLFVQTESNVVAYDSEGNELWTNDSSDEYTEDLALSPGEDTVYFTTPNDNVLALDATDGTEIASASVDTPLLVRTADDGRVVVGRGTSGVNIYDSQLNQISTWSGGADTAGGENQEPIAIHGETAISVGSSSSSLYAINTTDGSSKWTVTTSANYEDGLAVRDGEVVVLDSGTLTAYDLADGSELWTVSNFPVSSGPIYFAADDRHLVANGPCLYDIETETVVWNDATSPTDTRLPTTGQSVDGIAAPSLLFDEGPDGGQELPLRNGVIEVVEMTNAEGATVTHVNDETIADIEGLSATPDSIDTIVSEMDEFDSVADIEYTRDVQTILDHYGVEASVGGKGDGADITVQDTDYDRPNYDSTSSSEFAAEINRLEEKVEQLKAEEDGNGGPGPILPDGFGLGDSGALVGFAIIGVVVLTVVGFVTDMIPGVGN